MTSSRNVERTLGLPEWTWHAIVFVDGYETTLVLDVPGWFDSEDIEEAFVREAMDVYAPRKRPVVAKMW